MKSTEDIFLCMTLLSSWRTIAACFSRSFSNHILSIVGSVSISQGRASLGAMSLAPCKTFRTNDTPAWNSVATPETVPIKIAWDSSIAWEPKCTNILRHIWRSLRDTLPAFENEPALEPWGSCRLLLQNKCSQINKLTSFSTAWTNSGSIHWNINKLRTVSYVSPMYCFMLGAYFSTTFWNSKHSSAPAFL